MKTENARFARRYLTKEIRRAWRSSARTTIPAFMVASTMICAPAFAQQTTGSIKGQVTVAGTQTVSAAGVKVSAASAVMPKARTTVTRADGSFSLPLLIPGDYELTFTFADGSARKLQTRVLLDQVASANLVYQGSNPEVIVITGSSIVTEGNSTLTNSFGGDVIDALPTGQNYRDMLKILPGVAYSENSTLGISAGGSGVDNTYGFDGIDLSLPMFGNLSSEPSTHDVASVSVDRGGAKAIGFNRSGGFAVNTVSKSGTNEFHGSVEYRIQNSGFTATAKDGTTQDTDETWTTVSVSGPIIKDQLFFYGSYFGNDSDGDNKVIARGDAPGYSSDRDEYFGKLTWAPTEDILINISQRSSDNTSVNESIDYYDATSVSEGSSSDLSIFSVDGSWLVNDNSSLTFKYAKYEQDTQSQPDNALSVDPILGDSLDISDLASMGAFTVPSLREGTTDDPLTDADLAFNAGAQVYIDQYGYTNDDGDLTGGGTVGAASTYDVQNFSRESFDLAFDTDFETGNLYHTFHVGFQWSEIMEDLRRLSNGWGSISYIGGDTVDSGVEDVYYMASVQSMSVYDGEAPVNSIKSYAETYNFEINDTIEHGDFTYNLGLLISEDILYGQGLRKNSSTVSGYEVDVGHKYKMYTVDWKDMIQPRLGVTWQYQEDTSLFANYASYNPGASSLARAASWDRNIRSTLEVYFDENGDYMSSTAASGSSGKFFADNMKPRRIDEFTIGATKSITPDFLLRSHLRYRYGSHFWEDMPNDARLYGDYTGGSVPDSIASKGLYIDNLDELRDDIGGSSYVIAEVDGGQTKYWEWSLEAEWHGENAYINASYTWSHYYGNFDQDNTTSTNDANSFIGSSYYGDGKGRMVWDNKYGTLIGDKPHKLKVQGYYELDWDATVGAYFIFQSGEAWTAWDGSLYGYSSDTSRYAEPAGSRRGASHWQVDLNYTQDYALTEDYVLKFRADIYNLFNKQTGYNYNPYMSSSTFGEARDYYDPRRLQLSVGMSF
jgi:hypothetical protein